MTGGREPIGSVFPNLSSLDTPSTVDNRMNDAGETKVFNSGNVFLQFKRNRFVQYWISRSRYGGRKRTEKKGKGRKEERNQKKKTWLGC